MFYINDIKINNFRCYETKEVTFSNNTNIIIGKNAIGKTNLVEAISYLCLGKSFKGTKDSEVLKFGAQYFNITSIITEKENKYIKIVIGYDGKSKKLNFNGEIVKSLSEYIGKFKLITFSPDDLDLIKGSPSVRRRFLDINICQIDKSYLKLLNEYKHLLKQRNELLKLETIDYSYLDILSNEMVKRAKIIISKRQEFINQLNNYVLNKSNYLTNNTESVKIEFVPNCNITEIENKYKINRNYDILTKCTNIGPHKDDFNIYINDKNASIYSSQGQIRSAVLSIKLGLVDSFNKNNENFIIILDDVFSELDINRQIKLLESLKSNNQIFITTTDINNLPKEIVKESKIIKIEDGDKDE